MPLAPYAGAPSGKHTYYLSPFRARALFAVAKSPLPSLGSSSSFRRLTAMRKRNLYDFFSIRNVGKKFEATSYFSPQEHGFEYIREIDAWD